MGEALVELDRLLGEDEGEGSKTFELPFRVEMCNSFGEFSVVDEENLNREERRCKEKEKNVSLPFDTFPLFKCLEKSSGLIEETVNNISNRDLEIQPLAGDDCDESLIYRLGLCVNNLQSQDTTIELVYTDPLNASTMDMPLREAEISGRQPLDLQHFARGKSGNSPFTPGGIDNEQPREASVKRNAEFYGPEQIRQSLVALGISDQARDCLLRVPPGFDEFPAEIFEKGVAAEEATPLQEAENPLLDQALPELDYSDAPLPTREERHQQMVERHKQMLAMSYSLESDDEDDDSCRDEDARDFEADDSNGHQLEEDPFHHTINVSEENITTDSKLTDMNDIDVKDLEAELLEITEETSNVIAQDFFGATKQPEWKNSAKQGTDDNKWAVTQPVDTSTFSQRVPHPAIEYPFELDDFQKQAVLHLENGESVFVAAHTSAGKTVVAEYAIAMAMKHRTRVIYTSPIKALSNQKFRDFAKKFNEEDVGLVTGDVTINGSASCLVMTTEILRSMLYRGADLIRDIEWVIFDEVHYINDAERGVVWEEVIIMLPEHVNLIFLSATTPNTLEFSAWIGRTKKRRVHVISTEKRPVPLEHFMCAGGKLYKVMDAKKNFLKDGYNKAVAACKSADAAEAEKKNSGKIAPGSKKQQEQQKQRWKQSRGGGNEKTERSQWLTLIRDLEKRELVPVVVFSFSKRMCDERAAALTSLDMVVAKEKHRIHSVFARAMTRLQGSDKYLPQVLRVKELINRGIGVHHGGLLPILKEVVEILFCQGLIKILFATETFAIGVNMPARTVIFNGLRKHDGVRFRDILPGEYTQMAGRAGRRGIDTVGTVIISCTSGKEPPPIDVLSIMLTGSATKLTSQFRLSYTMILNLLRVAELTVADMIKRSFSEFGTQRLIGGRDVVAMISKGERRLKELKERLGKPCEDIVFYQERVEEMKNRLTPLVQQVLQGDFGRKAANMLFPVGRVVIYSDAVIPMSIGCVCKSPKAGARSLQLLLKVHGEIDGIGPTLYAKDGVVIKDASAADLLNIVLVSEFIVEGEDLLAGFSSLLTKHSAPSQKDEHTTVPGAQIVLSPLDPIKALKVGDLDFVQAWREATTLARDLFSVTCHTCKMMPEAFAKQYRISTMERKIRNARKAISDENLALFPDFQARINVLQYLGYISKSDRSVQLKGRAACEVNTCDELILTEMILDDVFGPLSAAECAALCSAMVMQKKCDDEPILTDALQKAKEKTLRITNRLDALQRRFRVEVDPDYVEISVNFALMEAVYEWARGMPFRDICKLTSLEEGSIVRCITRLDETCREVRNIAQIVGDAALFKKLEDASELIKRD
eukprot:CAMPEP_0203754358 /NCGR_PEP_ID=MMETSP0098-20131031/7960_1 /ASSEMBLY_ACC=CAM_ASM_000208 /TAXON_ID=96639 /ORGANISM=" , Strain NY0313808BC1" /LENGTH=1330 /DNA_ID=CAMNT_0050645317 /DNA_START=642 /DNA_END=4631 /DNA_ORIENTATION=-